MAASYTIVAGNLLDAKEELILQQNCCIACQAHGLSQVIAARYPYADPYKTRKRLAGRNMAIVNDRPAPGTIQVHNSVQGPTFVSMFAQYGMGRPYSYNNTSRQFQDGAEDRLKWFKSCLDSVAKLNPTSVAMPFQIGCGLAGGKWTKYEEAISDWALANPTIKVVLYRLV